MPYSRLLFADFSCAACWKKGILVDRVSALTVSKLQVSIYLLIGTLLAILSDELKQITTDLLVGFYSILLTVKYEIAHEQR